MPPWQENTPPSAVVGAEEEGALRQRGDNNNSSNSNNNSRSWSLADLWQQLEEGAGGQQLQELQSRQLILGKFCR